MMVVRSPVFFLMSCEFLDMLERRDTAVVAMERGF
jgi:hypothetical protein